MLVKVFFNNKKWNIYIYIDTHTHKTRNLNNIRCAKETTKDTQSQSSKTSKKT